MIHKKNNNNQGVFLELFVADNNMKVLQHDSVCIYPTGKAGHLVPVAIPTWLTYEEVYPCCKMIFLT